MTNDYKIILLTQKDLIALYCARLFLTNMEKLYEFPFDLEDISICSLIDCLKSNFEETAITKNQFIFFIFDSYLSNTNDINKLHCTLKEIRKGKPFKLLIADLGLTLDHNISTEISIFRPKYCFNRFKKQNKLKKLEKDFGKFIRGEIRKVGKYAHLTG